GLYHIESSSIDVNTGVPADANGANLSITVVDCNTITASLTSYGPSGQRATSVFPYLPINAFAAEMGGFGGSIAFNNISITPEPRVTTLLLPLALAMLLSPARSRRY